MASINKNFFVAGNSTFTVKVPEAFASQHGCNLHYTFKIQASEPSEKFPKPAHFVKLLTGSDNTSDYSYMGKLVPETGEVNLTAKSCVGEGAWSLRIVRRVLAQMFEGEGLAAIQAAGWDIDHMGKCGRCGRPLTVPESIECGIGPDCAEIMGFPYPVRVKVAKPRKPRTPKCVKVERAEVVADESAAESSAMLTQAEAMRMNEDGTPAVGEPWF